MLRIILLAGVAFGGLVSFAQAQTYSVDPGQWQWQADGVLAGAPIPFEGSECLTANEATVDVEQALTGGELEQCTFEERSAVGNLVEFSVSCEDGEIAFSASGTATVESKKVTVVANGYIVMEGLGEVPASIEATAQNTGQCTAP